MTTRPVQIPAPEACSAARESARQSKVNFGERAQPLALFNTPQITKLVEKLTRGILLVNGAGKSMKDPIKLFQSLPSILFSYTGISIDTTDGFN